MSTAATRMPSATKRSTRARPIPLAPPVTTATRPLSASTSPPSSSAAATLPTRQSVNRRGRASAAPSFGGSRAAATRQYLRFGRVGAALTCRDDRARLPHDARGVPPPRARRGRLDGRLPGAGRGAADHPRRRAGRASARCCPAPPPEQPEPFEAILADLDRVVMPGHHALAVARLLRVLPRQRLGAGDPRRAGLDRARRCRGCSGPPARPAPSSRPRARLAGRPARAPAALANRRRPAAA